MHDNYSQIGYYEFFSGGGLVRAALGSMWRCLFANDFDHKKNASYQANWGSLELKPGDVRELTTSDLPGTPDLAWASFPCQDLSLAGMGAGLRGERSGTFWPFWGLIRALKAEGRSPRMVVLENVCGALTSHGGKDFNAIAEALFSEGYKFGAIVVDAALFVPQSRKRLFIIAVDQETPIARHLKASAPTLLWHSKPLQKARGRLPKEVKQRWIWWNLVPPPKRTCVFNDIIEENPAGVSWHTPSETASLLEMMSPINSEKLQAAVEDKTRWAGTIYKRTRRDSAGNKVQRAEVRLDGVAGCLRTPAGGSSRQIVVVIKDGNVRTRLISPRETARLMGLPDSYLLPEKYNEAYYLTGDGVVVPVVRYLAENIFKPVLKPKYSKQEKGKYVRCSVQTEQKAIATN